MQRCGADFFRTNSSTYLKPRNTVQETIPGIPKLLHHQACKTACMLLTN